MGASLQSKERDMGLWECPLKTGFLLPTGFYLFNVAVVSDAGSDAIRRTGLKPSPNGIC